MQKGLLQTIAPRLRELDRGGYARSYRVGSRTYSSGLLQSVIEILDSLGVNYEENSLVPGTSLRSDIRVKGTFVFVDRRLPKSRLREMVRLKRKFVVITTSSERSDQFDPGVRVVEMGPLLGDGKQTIFLDDPSFNFDYSHILPKTQKCSVMHGHTSSALVEIIGRPIDGMVIDFGLAKDAIREAIRGLDHKLLINRKYVINEDAKRVSLSFETVHGRFAIEAPKATTVLLQGEATVENLAREVLARILPKMPENISAVGVFVYEGLNKGSHLLAQVHTNRARKSRKRP